jgi:antitoxin component of MazEF toxin-antitoxin module
MLIRAAGVTINVTVVKQIVVQRRDKVTVVKLGFFKSRKDTKTVYDVILLYKDQEGNDKKFRWHGAEAKEQAEAIEKELLSQIKEVELEHMSATLENAIRNTECPRS